MVSIVIDPDIFTYRKPQEKMIIEAGSSSQFLEFTEFTEFTGFIADGLDVDVRDVSGQTPLMLAAQKDGRHAVHGVHGVHEVHGVNVSESYHLQKCSNRPILSHGPSLFRVFCRC